MSVDEVEPIEAEAAEENAVAPQGTHLASTQTVTHEYLTQSGKVMRETVRTDGTVTSVLDFIYDESGKPFAMIDQLSAQPKTYYYVLNLQGDVVNLIDQDGAVAAAYAYDAWGNILSQSGNMAEKNPLRYRGYYYDSETGFYYLQSRYYDPATRRFINADALASTGQGFIGYNMFAYCNNQVTMLMDSSGSRPFVNLMATDSAKIDWRGFGKSQSSYSARDQRIFSDIEKNSEYPFWYGTVNYAVVRQVDDYESTVGTAVVRTIFSYSASCAGEKVAEKVVPKILEKAGVSVTTKAVNIFVGVASLGYDIFKTVKNYKELPTGTYNQYEITVEGFYTSDIYGIGSQTYYYRHTVYVAERTVGKDTSYVILDESYDTWR